MTNDLISRQAVLDIVDDLRDQMTVEGYWSVVERVKALPSVQPNLQPTCNQLATDCISRAAAIDALREIEFSHYMEFGEYIGEDTREVRLIRAEKAQDTIEQLPSAQPTVHPQRTCVNCGRTVNNGGWYADGRTRCPIEEHYALPKDGYCHLWEKRNVTDDDYPERREDERPES